MKNILLALFAMAGVANATLVGYTPASNYAIWDSYSAFQFAGASSDSSSGIAATLSQSQAIVQDGQGAGLYDKLTPNEAGDDIFFTGGNVVVLSVAGSFDFTNMTTFTLQMKRVGNTGTMSNNFAPTLSINGGSAFAFSSVSTASGSGDSTSDAGTWSNTTWSFTLPALTGVQSFVLSIPSSSPGTPPPVNSITRGVDYVAVQAVPEPSTYALIMIGAGAMFVLYRRKVKA